MNKSVSDLLIEHGGNWISHRRYIYPGSEKNCSCVSNLSIETEPTSEGCSLVLSWDTKGDIESKGQMTVEYNESTMIMARSRGYFTDNQTLSFVEKTSENSIQTKTEYNGKLYIERIEFWGDFRTRQTLGFQTNTNKLILVGQHYEEKQPCSVL